MSRSKNLRICTLYSSARGTKKYSPRICRTSSLSFQARETNLTRSRMILTTEDGKTLVSTMRKQGSSTSEREKANPSKTTSRSSSSTDSKPKKPSRHTSAKGPQSHQPMSQSCQRRLKQLPTREERSYLCTPMRDKLMLCRFSCIQTML